MPWKLSAVLAIALVWLSAPSARAGESGNDAEPVYDRDGWYVGFGGGYAMEMFEGGSSGDSGFAQIRAGYHFLRFVAAEVQLEYTPKFNGDSGRYAGVDTATWAAWANFKGYPTAPWTGCVQPFGLVGVAWMWERRTGTGISGSDEHGGFAARFGGGIDFYVTKNIVVTAESAWVLPTGSVHELNQLQIGGALQYRF
jgi:hypothetical protein